MANRMDILKAMPPMLTGDTLLSALSVLPDYNEHIRCAGRPVRLAALSDLYQIYLPSQMSVEIYSKLYLSLLRSLQKKASQLAVRQRYENHKAIHRQSHNGIIDGADSFTILGCSGIGKTSAISRAVSLISGSQILETDNPYCRIIPCLNVQCPFDSSVKGLMLEILRKADEELGTTYYQNAVRSRTTTIDTLIGTVSTVALNHIGLLVVDEIQNVVNSKNGKSLVGMLTQLINNSGISICMVGTNESAVFFEQAMQLARRSVGLQYGRLTCDRYFHEFCSTVFHYQYVHNRTEITASIIDWLYEHSAGVISVVVALIHDAQEIAILNGTEVLDLDTLNEAYRHRLTMLHGHIASHTENKRAYTPAPKSSFLLPAQEIAIEPHIIAELAQTAKDNDLDVVALLKQHFPVEEVVV